jgi:hypothetical protein
MRLCEIEGCDRKHDAKGYCNTHYTRWKRNGSPYDSGSKVCEKREHTKWCPGHQEWLPKDQFSTDNSLVDGLSYQCKECQAHSRRKHFYKVDRDRWEQMLNDQDHSCAICNATEPAGQGGWHVDHDHACCPGEKSCGACVRSLLCHNCNQGMGNFFDDPDRLLAAATYLISHSNNNREVAP